MTIWKTQPKPNADNLMNKLGNDVYNYLNKISNNLDFLSDYEYLAKNVKQSSSQWQLSDYSPLLLPLVKYYENSLWYICEELDLFNKINNDKKPYSLRSFFVKKKFDIENYLKSKIQDQNKTDQIIRRLFSTIDDYNQRNEVVHCSQLITFAELANYDSLITKLKELIDCLFENNLLSKN